MDWFIKGLIFTLICFMAFLVVVIIPEDMDRSSRAENLANEMGCTYLGNARDLNTVKFFQCGDEIVLKRVK